MYAAKKMLFFLDYQLIMESVITVSDSILSLMILQCRAKISVLVGIPKFIPMKMQVYQRTLSLDNVIGTSSRYL